MQNNHCSKTLAEDWVLDDCVNHLNTFQIIYSNLKYFHSRIFILQAFNQLWPSFNSEAEAWVCSKAWQLVEFVQTHILKISVDTYGRDRLDLIFKLYLSQDILFFLN